ncbi:MAG: NAD(P)H-hydrate dehydratase [Lysobacteraceae bacterium]|nr:MAG: NAD(P)H-hydrate dehydratase [Xanthomonadaceae bacterium]
MAARPTRITDGLLRRWPLPSLAGVAGKEDRGRVIVVGGSRQVPGGALLAGVAALRAGAGKLHIATAATAQTAMAIAVPEAKVSAVAEDAGGNLARMERGLVSDLAAADAILVGPGLEGCAASARLVAQVDAARRCPLVLDAGALDGFLALAPDPSRRIITPHFGEMARLVGLPIEKVESGAARLARDLARESGSIVVLKSPRTFIAEPGGKCWVHEDGTVGLGTSGSGDVLAGLITGLLARGASAAQAAVWGVRLHGKAGERLATRQGPVGFLAREIAPEVPRLLAGLCGPE